MKTTEQIIEETANHYNSNNRSLLFDSLGKPVYRYGSKTQSCAYNGKGDKKCAIARCCNEEIDREYEGRSAHVILEEFGQNILKPEYRGHKNEFWDKLQQLHDNPDNWNEDGLTKDGLIAKKNLIDLFVVKENVDQNERKND